MRKNSEIKRRPIVNRGSKSGKWKRNLSNGKEMRTGCQLPRRDAIEQ
jgi:hypothetical protein